MTTGLEHAPDDLRLGGRGHGNVDDLDAPVCQHVLECFVDAGDPVAPSHLGCTPRVMVVDAGDLETRSSVGGQVRNVDDRARPHDRDRAAVSVRDLDPAGFGDRIEPRDHDAGPPSRSAGIR